jgi:O-antigen/teichoic acid export membrane protein
VNRLRTLLGGGIRRDALWLFGGQLVALAVTFVATPIQLERMGAERYGIVVILSAAVGYVALLDIGAAWGVMRFVPWHRTRGDDEAAQRVVAAAVVLSLGVGLAVGLVVLALAPSLASLLDVSAGSAAQTTDAVRVMAAFVPVLLLTSLFSGLGRAVDMFALVGVVAAGQVVALNVVWAVVAGEPDDVLKVLIAQLLIGCAAIVITAVAIKARRGWALRPRLPSGGALREITSFGAKTSSGQAGLGMLLAADKPVLGSVMAVSAIPAYSIPFALALRIMLVSSSVSSAVFPPAVAALAAGDRSQFARLRRRAFAVVGLASGLLAVNCVFGGRPVLEWWLGDPVATDGWAALAILGVGFGVLACGSIGNILLDAGGRPGAAAAVMISGGVLGLALAGACAAVWGSAMAASAGICAGLIVVGLGGIELARRLVVAVPRSKVLATVFGTWLPLAAAGAALRLACELLNVPPLPTVLVIAAGTGAMALGLLRRIGGAGGETPAPATPDPASNATSGLDGARA